MAASLETSKDFLDVMHSCDTKACGSEKLKGHSLIIIEFGDRTTSLKRIFQTFAQTQPDWDLRRGRGARGPLARTTQGKLDKVAALMKKK